MEFDDFEDLTPGDSAADALALTLQQHYRNVFFPNGVKTASSERVIQDLAQFCRLFSTSLTLPGADTTMVLEGRREVVLRLLKMIDCDKLNLV